MEKLIIKFIYFLLRFVKSDIASIMLFKNNCAKIANGRYHTVSVEISQHTNKENRAYFTAYIDGYVHMSGSTPKEALDKFNTTSNKKVIKVTKVLD